MNPLPGLAISAVHPPSRSGIQGALSILDQDTNIGTGEPFTHGFPEIPGISTPEDPAPISSGKDATFGIECQGPDAWIKEAAV